jgi:hypothetical protein
MIEHRTPEDPGGRTMHKNPDADPPAERNPIERGPIKQARPRSKPLLNWRTFDPSSINGDDSLAEELLTYKQHLDELLKRKGQYVLIKGSEVIDYFSTLDAALEAAAERFGGAPALIKQVVEREPVYPAGGLAL